MTYTIRYVDYACPLMTSRAGVPYC